MRSKPGTSTLICLTPTAGALPLTMAGAIRVQTRIQFLRHLKSQQEKWTEMGWKETMKGSSGSLSHSEPGALLGPRSAPGPSLGQVAVCCVCVCSWGVASSPLGQCTAGWRSGATWVSLELSHCPRTQLHPLETSSPTPEIGVCFSHPEEAHYNQGAE